MARYFIILTVFAMATVASSNGASASPAPERPLSKVYNGTASLTIPTSIPSACNGTSASSPMVAGAGDDIWDGGHACGKKYIVRCSNPANVAQLQPCKNVTVVVTVTSHCCSCKATMTLSKEAFSTIADPTVAGIVNISFKQLRLY